MRCKKHYTDLSSIHGVCASCLRVSLLSVVAAQEQVHAQAQTLEETNCNSQTCPVFPRSVSPYIRRRKIDNSVSTANNQGNSDRNRQRSVPNRRFSSTPQVAPTTESNNSCRKKRHGFIPFSLSKLFRSKKTIEDSDRRYPIPVSEYRGTCGANDSVTSVMLSPLCFSNIRSGGGCRKKQPICFRETSTTSGACVNRKQYCPDRGMSPVRLSDCADAEDESYDASGVYETCEPRKQVPAVRRGGGGGNGKNISGMTFCLSPLVRASPCRRWNKNGVAPVDGSEISAPVKRAHLSNTKAFCANRSRKVADFGRSSRNR